MPLLPTGVHLVPEAPTEHARALEVLMAAFHSPYLSDPRFHEVTVEPVDVCQGVAAGDPLVLVPLRIRAMLQSVADVPGSPEPGRRSLFDDYLAHVVGSDLSSVAQSLDPFADASLHLRTDDGDCAPINPAQLWWWLVSMLLSGPHETYERQHHLARHAFVRTDEGENRIADVRLFLPTAHGQDLRGEVAEHAETIAVPQGLLPTLGQLLPEAQPYLLPVDSPIFESINYRALAPLVRGTVTLLPSDEADTRHRQWRSRARRSAPRGLAFRRVTNKLIASLYRHPHMVRLLRTPSRALPKLSRWVRGRLSTTGSHLRNPYLHTADLDVLDTPSTGRQ